MPFGVLTAWQGDNIIAGNPGIAADRRTDNSPIVHLEPILNAMPEALCNTTDKKRVGGGWGA